jgi:hypothetical protein
MEKLSDKQVRFIEEYLIDGNGTQAAIRAGYSEKTANEQAARMLAKVNIQYELKKRQEELSLKLTKTRDDIIDDLINVINTFLLDGRNTPNALKAIEILNKMTGWNSPDKTEILHQGVVINYINPNKNNE